MKIPSVVVALLSATSVVEGFAPWAIHLLRHQQNAAYFVVERTTRIGQSSAIAEPEMEAKTKVEQSAPTPLQAEQPKEAFVNKGPMAWMQQYLELAGITPGETIAYGPFTTGPVPESKRASPEEAALRREEATRNLQNIDMDERNRRLQASKVMTVVTVVYAVWAALIGDQGDFGGHMLRLLTFFPLMLSVGYRLSYESGL